MKYQEDIFYIEKVLEGDVSSYEMLVRKHKNLVFSIVFRILNSREDAEEIAQDVFLKVYQSLNTFKKESKFSTWLYRVAYNAAISRTRKKRIEMVGIEDNMVDNYTTDEIHQNTSHLDENDRQVILERALKKLPEEDNLLLTLFYKNENSIEDISYITGMTESNVKVRLHRIRKKLYDEMQEMMKVI
ncbi:MAG: RNA polymerase sigma factor [Syntrophothermus sp.]